MSKRERIILRIDVDLNSIEGQVLNFIKDESALTSKEATMRALKAFYLPWVLEGKQSQEKARAIAKTMIEELQYRVFQIKQRFLPEEVIPFVETIISENRTTSIPGKSQTLEASLPTTVEQMQDELDPTQVSQFLDDF
jgi:hypothetical protein